MSTKSLILDLSSSKFHYILSLVGLIVNVNFAYASETPKILTPINSHNLLLAQQNSVFQFQGTDITLNGSKPLPAAWSQWQESSKVRTGISDTAARHLFGLEFLSTNNPNIQPIFWFQGQQILATKWSNPYRYLDITDLLTAIGAEVQVINQTLNINFNPPQITNIRLGNQPWGKRVVIDLDRPTFWQVNQVKNQGIINLEALAIPPLLAQFQPNSNSSNSNSNSDEDNLSSVNNNQSLSDTLSLEKTGNQTIMRLDIPSAHRLKISSLSNPNRIVVDIRPDAFVESQIVWQTGIIWLQKFIALNNKVFPVIALEIDPKTQPFYLKPITSNPNTVTGINPLVNTARSQGAIASINGGFFNRDNKLPLGAIRYNGEWLSGPILNRGAIAWDNQGNWQIGNLQLNEVLITQQGQRLPILFLNSGYVQAGIARYTKDWGATYTPMSAKETIIIVENNLVTQQLLTAPKAPIPIPNNGYLLTSRNQDLVTNILTVNSQVSLQSNTIPTNWQNYPNILGAGPVLIKNKQIVLNAAAEKFSPAFQKQLASRSAIAINNQGKIMLIAVHNRIGGLGPSLDEFAQILQKLGAVEALNLDGGSSTSLYLGGQLIDRSPATAARVHNGIGIFIRK